MVLSRNKPNIGKYNPLIAQMVPFVSVSPNLIRSFAQLQAVQDVAATRSRRMGCYFNCRYWVVPLVVSWCLAGCTSPGVIAPIGDGFQITEVGCLSCDPGDQATRMAKEYCAERGKRYWSVRDLDGLDLSELSAHVFYCEDQAQRDESLYWCNRVSQDLARASFADDDLIEVLRQIFPASQVTALKRLRSFEKANAETRRAIEILSPVYKSCVADLSEDQVLTQRAYVQLHLGARLSLLKRLRHGAITLLAYASEMSMLNSQLAAGVFVQ